MKNNKNELFKELAGLTVFEAIKWLIVLIAGWVFSLLGVQSLSSLPSLQFLIAYKIYIIVFFFLVTTWIVLWLFERSNRHRPVFPKLDSDFYILDKEISFIYKSPTEIVYKRKYKLKALKNNLERYPDRYCWTGDGQQKPIVCTHPDQSVEKSKAKDVYQFFDVILERAFQKGETIDTEIVWNLEDPEHTAGPFISATIWEPTDKLTMTVELADCLGVSSVVMEHSADAGTKKHFDTSTAKLINRKHTWAIDSPNLLHLYRIRWIPHLVNNK